ncbi:MAG: ABC transporter ATP-binding protein [Lachnospiraceae bacterium]|nr:ABC transporter ATP-binding protein [Lachnospiraceae bacterium]
MIPKLEVKDLCYSYHSMDGETQALSDISLTVSAGEFLAVVGPSGCGKSTLLSLMTGLLTPSKGQILMDGTAVQSGDTRIGYMLQKDHLFEWRTVFSNACLGLEIRKELDASGKEKVHELLKAYGLDGFANAHPSELSGGMRQRAALIRTLALEPELLLLDEPFSALDYQTRLAVCDDISTIIRRQKKTAVLITHDLSEAVSVADRIVILTPRPGHIKKILNVTFPDSAISPLMRRNCPEFSSYFNEVWEILREDVAGGDVG